MHFHDNAGIGILVAVELQVFRGNACLGKQLPQIQNTEFFREVFRIPATESDKTKLDLASYRLDSQNSFKEHLIVEVLNC
jgi:hypothetical protein